MAKEILENENNNTSFTSRKPQSIDVGQFEYTINQTLTYGSLIAILITLGVTYAYLVVKKITA